MAGKKGQQKVSGSGRKKGTPNKITTQIKDLVLGALSDVGGRLYLAQQAKKNPVAFLGLVGKVLPLQVQGEMDSRVTIKVINFAEMGDDAGE